MNQKISILLIMVGIVITTTNCSTNPHDSDWYLTYEETRHENLLKELLIEMQETNATLKRIEDRLDR